MEDAARLIRVASFRELLQGASSTTAPNSIRKDMVHLCAGFRLGNRPGTSPRKSADAAQPVVSDRRVERQRELCFDFVRGMMILWVFVIHVALNGGICRFGEAFSCRSVFCWLSFYMATFYFFSGYLLRYIRSPRDTFLKGISSLLLPCVAMTVFGLVIYVVMSFTFLGSIDWKFPFKGAMKTFCLRTNTPCWFFVSLFFVKLLHSTIYRFLHGTAGTTAMSILLVLIAWKTCNRPQFFGYGNVCIGFFFYNLGFLSKRFSKIADNGLFILSTLVVYVTIPFLTPLGLWFSQNVRTETCRGVGYMLDIAFSGAACLILCSFARRIPLNGPIAASICHVGRDSLFFFGIHRPILNFAFDPLFNRIFASSGTSMYFVTAIIFLLLAGSLCVRIWKRIGISSERRMMPS